MSIPAPHKLFNLPLTVAEADIDELGHVNNVVYVRWAQEAAAAHWQQLAPAEWRHKYLWVVLRHEIDYRQPVLPGTPVMAQTWVGDHRGATSTRFVRIVSPDAKTEYAAIQTTWCLLAAASGRPMRINEEVLNALDRELPGTA